MVYRPEKPTIYISPEENVIPPGEFSERSRRAIEERGLPDGSGIGREVTTTSNMWGNIWRGDMIPETEASRYGMISRVMCWIDPFTGELRILYAFGQRVPKL